MAHAEIDRSSVHLTNRVKHFKYRSRGKRRIHQHPRAGEIAACRQWLAAELDGDARESALQALTADLWAAVGLLDQRGGAPSV